MATLDDKAIVDEIIAGNGQYSDDPPVVKIVEYRNYFNGGLAWGLIYQGEPLDKYRESPYVIEPRTIWEIDWLARLGRIQ